MATDPADGVASLACGKPIGGFSGIAKSNRKLGQELEIGPEGFPEREMFKTEIQQDLEIMGPRSLDPLGAQHAL